MPLFHLTEYDREVYETQIRDFLPQKMIDIHTHVWVEDPSFPRASDPDEAKRTVTWPSLVAKDDSVKDLIESYHLIFPGKEVVPLMFSTGGNRERLQRNNAYMSLCARATGFPALYYSHPEESAEEIEKAIIAGGFLGLKSYLDLAPAYLPEAEIRIFDFFTPAQLEKIDQMGLIVMLHIPRNGRLKDPVNLSQVLEIKRRFPNIKLILAHIGRAYCAADIGNAFEVLSEAPDLMFDFSANTCETAMTKLLESVGADHAMFGSDLPVTRMRMRRIEENDTYINLIPPGLYGDPRQDKHLREVSEAEGKRLTLFMYEEILSFKRAAQTAGLSRGDVEKVFYLNASGMIDSARKNLTGWMAGKGL